MNFGIIGFGKVGQLRAKAIASLGHRVIAVYDSVENQGALSQIAPDVVKSRASDVWDNRAVDAVVIATPHVYLARLATHALSAGKHVLVEKPGAVSAEKLSAVCDEAAKRKLTLRVGYNLRFHPAIMDARKLVAESKIGEIMHLRACYGHGGREGYEREWRASKEMAGGGVLMDLGTHLIDLAQWFMVSPHSVDGHVDTSFWEMPVEDNAFVSLRSPTGRTAWLHASCTEWKNLFSLEIFGTAGKLEVSGLGKSYGPETLTVYSTEAGLGRPPSSTSTVFDGPDKSWEREVTQFVRDIIETGANQDNHLHAAVRTLEAVERIYGQKHRKALS